VSTSIDSGATLTLNFNEPNLQMDEECLSVGINHYIVHYGSESGFYTNEISIAQNELDCPVVGSNICGDTTRCSIIITI
jgi:hypothetical protein